MPLDHYFRVSQELNSLPGDKTTPQIQLSKENDNYLEHMLRVLKVCHTKFYNSPDPSKADIKEIIRETRLEVLSGCTIIFSGIIPVNVKPCDDPTWKLAEGFGATCLNDFEDGKEATHLIAKTPGTNKVNRAKKTPSLFLVNLEWLFESTRTWTLMNEFDFPLDNLPVLLKGSSPPTIIKKKIQFKQNGLEDEPERKRIKLKAIEREISSSDSEEGLDDEDLDLVAQWEGEMEDSTIH